MTMSYSTDVKNARAQALVNKIDVATTPAKLILYSGVKPLGVGKVTDQVALVTLTLAKPCYTSISDGVIYLAAVPEQMVLTTGEVTWARIVTGADAPVGDVDVGITGSGADLMLPTTELIAGSYVRLTAGQLREG